MKNETLIEISHAPIPEKLEIQEEIKKFLDKFQDRWKISRIRLNVDVHSPGGRLKYSIHAKMIASDILFNVRASGWDVPSTLNILFEKLSKMVGKELKKRRMEKISISRKILSKI
jgi:ribosome-associated translation inhibitor RaiA